MQLYTLPSIDYLRLRFHLKALKDCDLPSWKGSLLRGAFGHALKRTVCTMNKEQLCENCMLRDQCAYTRMFETFITNEPPPFLKGMNTSPRPFIFEPHDRNKFYKENDILWLDLILVGEATNLVPYIVFAMMILGHLGLGFKRHEFQLERAFCYQPTDEMINSDDSLKSNGDWRLLYEGDNQKILFTPQAMSLKNSNSNPPNGNSLKIKFLTQTRLKFQKDLTMDFTFRMLVFKMLRRVLELAYFYMSGQEINWEFHSLLEAASDIKMKEKNLHWEDWERYSNRQRSKMKLGGFVGDMTLEGDLSPFMDLLSYSEMLHVGKGTTFGLGKIANEWF